MKTKTLGTGTYPVVAVHGSHVWAAWQDGASLVLASFDPSLMDPSGDPGVLVETFRRNEEAVSTRRIARRGPVRPLPYARRQITDLPVSALTCAMWPIAA